MQVFDLFTVPSYNGYMAAAYKNYTIDWTPKVSAPCSCPWTRVAVLTLSLRWAVDGLERGQQTVPQHKRRKCSCKPSAVASDDVSPHLPHK